MVALVWLSDEDAEVPPVAKVEALAAAAASSIAGRRDVYGSCG